MPPRKTTRSCVSCSFRRIPCEGVVPCKACVSQDRECVPFSRRRHTKSKPTLKDTQPCSLSLLRPPSSQIPFVSRTEKESFEYFRITSIHSLPSGFFKAVVWNGEILAASMHIPVLRHAIVAFGASLTTGPTPTQVFRTTYAQACYGRAMMSLRQAMDDDQSFDLSITLVICLLFALIECRFLNLSSAKTHYIAAQKVIGELQSVQDAGTHRQSRKSLSRATQVETTIALAALGMQFSSVFPQAQRELIGHSASAQPAMVSIPSRNTPPQSLHDASEALQTNIVRLGQLTRELWHEYLVTIKGDFPQRTSSHHELLHSMRCWELELRREDRLHYFPEEAKDALLVEAHVLCVRLLAIKMLSKANEMFWDGFPSDFERLLLLINKIVDTEKRSSPFPFCQFVTDFGVLKLLYFLITKCREPHIRHPALRTLLLLNHYEGIWHSQNMAKCMAAFVEIEEEGLQVVHASDIPEARRLPIAQFDFSDQDWKVVRPALSGNIPHRR